MLIRVRVFLAFLLVLAMSFVMAPTPASATTTPGCSVFPHIIDVSDAQGYINWPAVPSSGIAGAYIKATEGTTYVASSGARNRLGAFSAGILHGSYDFARPSGGTSAQAEALFFVAHGGAEGTLPPMLDLETVGGLDPQALGAWARTWLDVVHYLTGRQPIVYTGGYFPVDASYLPPNSLWIAAYPAGYTENPDVCSQNQPRTPGDLPWMIWQYTSSSTVSGISGHVDQSIVNPLWFAYLTGIVSVPAPSGNPNDAPWSEFRIGSHGPGVVQIQQIVGASLDGVYGPATAAAVARFQVALGLSGDGIWGQSTQEASDRLFAFLAALPVVVPIPDPTLPRPSSVWAVIVLQWDLNRLGADIAVTGQYDWMTAVKVRDLQRTFALSNDGIYGPRTAAVLRLAIG
jgi:lysozyme